jgi:endogenous inhibitor of DNA gyrase (YacG/DUF329 family)
MTETPKKAPSCAICGKPVDPAYKPFCSKRCANLDLHRWLNGSYVIAGESAEDHLDDESDLAPTPPSHDDE